MRHHTRKTPVSTGICTACVCLLSLMVLSINTVQASSPRLSIIMPRGVQRGTEAVLTFSGRQLNDAEEIFFYEKGFEVKKIEAVNANSIKVTVNIAADCQLGEHTAQVRCKSGVSDYRTFYVGQFPIVDEKEPNSGFDTPQQISLNQTIRGVVQSEDVDYYVVEAKKGQRLSVEVEAMRLGTYLFDAYIAILNDKRFELATADDTTLVYQDCTASIVVPEDGKYTVMIRESAYGGNGNCRYRLHIGTFPRPKAVFPAGGKLGEEITVKYLGDPKTDLTAKVKLPAEKIDQFGLFAQDDGGIAPSANTFRLFEHGNAFEKEPNNDVKTASPAELPLAFNGIIEAAGDTDFFRFSAKKGQVYEVECFARRIRSSLDPVMYLYRASDNRQLASNDDSRGPDSYFRFTVPADGEYLLRIRDHLDRGGANFVYRVEFQKITPTLAFSIPRITRYGQERQQIVIPRGNRFATLINARRTNFGGELQLDLKNLPQGVKVIADKMPANMTTQPVLFEAAADAPIAGKLIPLAGRHVDPNTKIVGRFTNSADLVRGGNNQLFWKKDVNQVPIAVIDEAPWHLEIIPPKVPLCRNGSLPLKIKVTRKEGFKEAIRVQFPFRPPGVSTTSAITIPGDKSEATYPLNANGSARLGTFKVYVLGSANVNGELLVSSQLADLTIAEPYINLTLDRSAVEQGQATEMLVKVETKTPFEGTAKLKLIGLPHKVVTEELEFNKETKELVFKITSDKTSPPGRHRNLFCYVNIPQHGEMIVHRAGSSEIRIDKPLPAPVEKKPEPKPVAKTQPKPMPKAAPPKRLSRLEQLRLEAKKKAEAQKSGSE